jgi:hypothetical protein
MCYIVMCVIFNGSVRGEMGERWHLTRRRLRILSTYVEGTDFRELHTGAFVPKRMISAVNTFELVSDRVSIMPRGH